MAKKYVYYFGDGKAEGTSNMKELLGGKGAGLAEMTKPGGLHSQRVQSLQRLSRGNPLLARGNRLHSPRGGEQVVLEPGVVPVG